MAIDKPRYTLYHTWSDNVCAYCRKHHAGVTPRQLKQKRCLAKQCKHLKRYPDHPLWQQRAAKKARKQQADEA